MLLLYQIIYIKIKIVKLFYYGSLKFVEVVKNNIEFKINCFGLFRCWMFMV